MKTASFLHCPSSKRHLRMQVPFAMISVPCGTGDICFANDIRFADDIRLQRIIRNGYHIILPLRGKISYLQSKYIISRQRYISRRRSIQAFLPYRKAASFSLPFHRQALDLSGVWRFFYGNRRPFSAASADASPPSAAAFPGLWKSRKPCPVSVRQK